MSAGSSEANSCLEQGARPSNQGYSSVQRSRSRSQLKDHRARDSLHEAWREAVKKLKKENATLELMVQSHDELIMEIAAETELNRMGKDDDKHEDNGNDDKGDDVASPAAVPPPAIAPHAAAATIAAAPELIVVEEEEDQEMLISE
jgi:uncharacterized protein YdcH (DUF465 family)